MNPIRRIRDDIIRVSWEDVDCQGKILGNKIKFMGSDEEFHEIPGCNGADSLI